MPFSVGDRVTIIAAECDNQHGGTNDEMVDYIGHSGIVLNIFPSYDSCGCGYYLAGTPWSWDEKLLVLSSEDVKVNKSSKHIKVIAKIKQMETRRKQLGYKTYQFVTGQEDKSDVQYKVDMHDSVESFRRFTEYMATTSTGFTAYELDF